MIWKRSTVTRVRAIHWTTAEQMIWAALLPFMSFITMLKTNQVNTGPEFFVLTWGESKGYRLLNLKSSWNFSPSYSVPGAPSMSTIHLKRKATSLVSERQNKAFLLLKIKEAQIPAGIILNVSYQHYSKHVIKSCELDPNTATFNIQLGYEANLVLLLHPCKRKKVILYWFNGQNLFSPARELCWMSSGTSVLLWLHNQ